MLYRLIQRPLTHAAIRIARRNFAGGGSTDNFYGRLMANSPLLTSGVTGGILWALGDLAAQRYEAMSERRKASAGGGAGEGGRKAEDEPLDLMRTSGTVFHGFFVGGVGAYKWYTFMDSVVRNVFKFTPGGAAFVAGKIAMEVAFWYPTALFAYWCIVGTFQGHSPAKIRDELAGTAA